METAAYKDGIPLEVVYSLAQRVPYLGVYRDASMVQDTVVDVLNLPVAGDEEVPVAWVCSKPTGDVGKGGTEEDFRGRGFGRLLGKAVARQQAALLGFIPHGFVNSNNFVSRLFFSKSVCWSSSHEVFSLVKDQTRKVKEQRRQ